MFGLFWTFLGSPWAMLAPCWLTLGPHLFDADWQNLLSIGVEIQEKRSWSYLESSWGHLGCQEGLTQFQVGFKMSKDGSNMDEDDFDMVQTGAKRALRWPQDCSAYSLGAS